MNTKRLKNLWKYDFACFFAVVSLHLITFLFIFEKERKSFDWQSFFLFVFVLEKRNCLWSAHTSSGVQYFKVFPILWGKCKQCHQKRFVWNARLNKSILLYCFYVCSTLENFQLLCTLEFPIRITSTACDGDMYSNFSYWRKKMRVSYSAKNIHKYLNKSHKKLSYEIVVAQSSC